MTKKEKKQTSKPLLKEQERIDLELKSDGQEHTNEAGFQHSEETLALGNRDDSNGSDLSAGSPDDLLAQGTLIDQKYEIVMLLGSGGMGSVYLAKHLELGTQVALKVLHRHLVNTPSALERFKTEARAAHSLSAKNLVSVLDYGVLADGQPYLTMHCVDGVNLADYLKSKGSLSIGETFSVVRQVAAALEEAHNKGIVHRDIKPSNILIEGNTIKEGSVKVVDFGISKGLSNESSSQQVTHTGQVFGSPFYMSPEQCKGNAVDFRTDLYSLGCVMFECLTGSWPFYGSNAIETLMMHCNETPPTLGVKGKPPKGFTQAKTVLKKLLDKDPAQRYPNAAALSEALQGFETEASHEKLFAFGRAQTGDKRFKEEMARIAVMLVSLTLVYFFLASKTNNSLNIDRNERLEELYKLGNMTTETLGQIPDSQDEKYLLKAIKFAEEAFGAYSLEAAGAYGRLGHYFTMYRPHEPPTLERAYKSYNRALEIVEYLDQHQPKLRSTKQFKSTKQQCLLDLATVSRDFGEDKNLVERAIQIGPLPKHFIYWNQCQGVLLKQNRYYDAAIAFIQMQTGEELHLTEAELKHMKTQTVVDFVGNHKLLSDLQNYWTKGEIEITQKGNSAECVFNGSGGYPTDKGRRAYVRSKSFAMNGTVENGVMRARTSDGPVAYPYLIMRVGKYLVLMDSGVPSIDLQNNSIPTPLTDCLFKIE